MWCIIQICLKDFWRTTWTMSSFWQPTTRVTNLIAQIENVCLVHLWLGGDYLWLTIQMFRIDYCVCHAWQRQTSRRWCGSVVRDTLGTAIKRRLIAWFPRTQIIRVSENGESWDNTRDGWLFGDRWHCSWGDDLNCSSVKSILERVAVIADGDWPGVWLQIGRLWRSGSTPFFLCRRRGQNAYGFVPNATTLIVNHNHKLI